MINMLKLQALSTNSHTGLKLLRQVCSRRAISALYITGDKANQNYVVLQPFMDFEGTLITQKEQLEYSLTHRLRSDVNLDEILDKYKIFKDYKDKLEDLETQRAEVANILKQFHKNNTTNPEKEKHMKQGKLLRDEYKTIRNAFYPIEDEFAHIFLNLPTALHKFCPHGAEERLLYRSATPLPQKANCHMERTDLIKYLAKHRYYLMEDASHFDFNATQALLRYFVFDADFTASSNPDFVRQVLLEAMSTPIEQYHRVMEEQLQNSVNPAYLVGGGGFESFLGALARLNIYPSVLPLRYVACGRSYEKTNSTQAADNLFNATQSNAVQTMVVTQTAQQADEEMENILNYALNFYKELGLHFRIVYAGAAQLTNAEMLRANIEVYSPAQERYITVGRISNYGDFISKRIMFTLQLNKKQEFLHMVGGPVMFTSRLIGALIEHDIDLNKCKLLGAFNRDDAASNNEMNAAIDEFKNLFK